MGNPKAKVLAAALDKAVGTFLVANKNPSRKVREIDNRGSHYWVARYWAEELAKQGADAALQKTFSATAAELRDNEGKAKTDKAMNPSEVLNSIIARLTQGPDARV